MRHFHIYSDKNSAIGLDVSTAAVCCIDDQDDVLFVHDDNLETVDIIQDPDDESFIEYKKILKFTSKEDGSSILLDTITEDDEILELENTVTLYYSIDGKTFNSWNGGLITLNDEEGIYIYGDNPTSWVIDEYIFPHFSMTGKFDASGNIMSLISKDCPDTIPFDYCFYNLFNNNCGNESTCSLLTPPELPATTLTKSCYNKMFAFCLELIYAPELPATTLTKLCYTSMFYDCTSLVNAPELPATTLADYCYEYMFYYCTSLAKAPELHATTLTEGCYDNMFEGCTRLSVAPELPATILTYACYRRMFYDCTRLSVAPELPATILAECCYDFMFSGCTSLANAPELPATTLSYRCYENMFQGCTSLTTAPELPATNLAYYCYDYMFSGCTSLVNAPELPATTLTGNCYNSMFLGCTSLANAPELPATTLAESCYWGMFSGCTSLANAPELPATTLAESCYVYMFNNCTRLIKVPELHATTLYNLCYCGMFENCTSLITAPELPATTLTTYCYNSMFLGCTSLTTAPELPATTLTEGCYNSMFLNCTSLRKAPELPARTLAYACYQQMFKDCTNLNYIEALFRTNISSNTSYTYLWLDNVSETGTFKRSHNATWERRDVHGVPQGWTDEINYLKFTCVSESGSIMLDTFNEGNRTVKELDNEVTIGYSFNGSDLTTWTGGVLALSEGDSVYVVGVNPNGLYTENCSGYLHFSMTGEIEASGNIQSLISLDCPNKIPSYSDDESCSGYQYMFFGCTSLTKAPELSATTIPGYAYYCMFLGCTSLTEAPELPAVTLTLYCYVNMFNECTSLTTAPELPATTLAEGCYHEMFYDCTSLIKAPELPAITLAEYCYYNMFWNCTSLTEAPELPATTLADYCYSNMFCSCSNLIKAPELPATTLQIECYSLMFFGCKKLRKAPELPAITLTEYCYDFMFYNCISLNYIKAMFTDTPSTEYTNNWVYGVYPKGTFIKNSEATWNVIGDNGIPNRWTIESSVSDTVTIPKIIWMIDNSDLTEDEQSRIDSGIDVENALSSCTDSYEYKEDIIINGTTYLLYVSEYIPDDPDEYENATYDLLLSLETAHKAVNASVTNYIPADGQLRGCNGVIIDEDNPTCNYPDRDNWDIVYSEGTLQHEKI